MLPIVFEPFDIVLYHYYDLNSEKKAGLFLVLYCDNGNCLAAKITSQFKQVFLKYSCFLLKRTHPFLETDSYIQLDKLNTLNTLKCRQVGVLNPVVRRTVKDILNIFHYEVLRKMNENISLEYISPNV